MNNASHPLPFAFCWLPVRSIVKLQGLQGGLGVRNDRVRKEASQYAKDANHRCRQVIRFDSVAYMPDDAFAGQSGGNPSEDVGLQRICMHDIHLETANYVA